MLCWIHQHVVCVAAFSVEGIYRIPGNAAHAELLKEMFNDNKELDIRSMDIGIHAVATALKGFFSDLSEPLVPIYLNQELVVADSKSIICYMGCCRDMRSEQRATSMSIL